MGSNRKFLFSPRPTSPLPLLASGSPANSQENGKKKSSGRRREKEEERGKTGRVTETDQTKHDVGIRVAAETRSDDGRERERGREWGGTKPYASLSLSLSHYVGLGWIRG